MKIYQVDFTNFSSNFASIGNPFTQFAPLNSIGNPFVYLDSLNSIGNPFAQLDRLENSIGNRCMQAQENVFKGKRNCFEGSPVERAQRAFQLAGMPEKASKVVALAQGTFNPNTQDQLLPPAAFALGDKNIRDPLNKQMSASEILTSNPKSTQMNPS
jgi:hypothetical protein